MEGLSIFTASAREAPFQRILSCRKAPKLGDGEGGRILALERLLMCCGAGMTPTWLGMPHAVASLPPCGSGCCSKAPIPLSTGYVGALPFQREGSRPDSGSMPRIKPPRIRLRQPSEALITVISAVMVTSNTAPAMVPR